MSPQEAKNKESIMHRFLLSALVLTLLCLPSAHGRGLESWSPERLRKEADVVVIATATASKDTRDSFKARTWEVEFTGVDTTFAVETVLKGKVEGDRLTVRHYRLKPGVLIQDGPLLVSFRTRGMQVNLKHGQLYLGRPSYLLFLKKRKDGRYEMVSGQIDPALAVREMYRPLPDMMGKDE
jgi:hypothetical protein